MGTDYCTYVALANIDTAGSLILLSAEMIYLCFVALCTRCGIAQLPHTAALTKRSLAVSEEHFLL